METPELPKTSFSCAGKPHIPGLYADIEAECKLFHYCYDDTDAVFACPENTLFNQKTLVCEWAEVVSCSDSPKHYDSNKGIGEESAEETPVKGAPAAQEPVAPIAAQESVKVQAPVVAPAPTKSIVNPVVARINAIAPLIDVRGPAAKSKQIAALRPRQIAIRKGIKA